MAHSVSMLALMCMRERIFVALQSCWCTHVFLAKRRCLAHCQDSDSKDHSSQTYYRELLLTHFPNILFILAMTW